MLWNSYCCWIAHFLTVQEKCCGDKVSFNWNSPLLLFPKWSYIWFLSFCAYVLIVTWFMHLSKNCECLAITFEATEKGLVLQHFLAVTCHCHLPSYIVPFPYLLSKSKCPSSWIICLISVWLFLPPSLCFCLLQGLICLFFFLMFGILFYFRLCLQLEGNLLSIL